MYRRVIVLNMYGFFNDKANMVARWDIRVEIGVEVEWFDV